MVFHAGAGRPSPDDWRGIDYAHARLDAEHVRASAASPAAFRPVPVTTPASARGWYFDGGTRLNTPIKPALALGANRIIVVGLNATRPAPRSRGDDRCPDVFHGIGQLTQAVLARAPEEAAKAAADHLRYTFETIEDIRREEVRQAESLRRIDRKDLLAD